MAGLGVEKLEKLMPEIVATASKVDIAPHVRDGYIMMFNYLPITFGDKFTPYVGPIIPCILKVGTADQAEKSATGEGGSACAMVGSEGCWLMELRGRSLLPAVQEVLSSFLSGCLGKDGAALTDTPYPRVHRLLLMRTSLCVILHSVRASGSSPCMLRRPSLCCCPSWSKASLTTSGE